MVSGYELNTAVPDRTHYTKLQNPEIVQVIQAMRSCSRQRASSKKEKKKKKKKCSMNGPLDFADWH